MLRQYSNDGFLMGYDLSLQSDPSVEFRWTTDWWSKILEFAELRGWVPKGTIAPTDWSGKHPNEQWDGNYSWNGGEVVEADDAKKLAAAIRSGLSEPGEFNQKELTAFIEFCEKGAFLVN